MDKNERPTVYDINKPGNVGATPGLRPIITGHQPTMPDPMVNPPNDTVSAGGSKINVKVENKSEAIDADSLASSLFPAPKPEVKANVIRESGDGPPLMEGEPLQSPPFKPEGDSQTAPYMPVSSLTGINTQAANPKTAANMIDDVKLTTEPKPAVFGRESIPDEPPKPPKKKKKSGGKVWLALVALLMILAGLYAAVDKGLILSSVDLPFHIFSQKQPSTDTASPPNSTEPTIPTGFTGTKLVEANLSFTYPTVWGAPTAATDQGFSVKRSASAKPDANYAFLVSFPDNKDVQIAITSGKYLPPARETLYYDFLGWCSGSADGKYYTGVLRFTTDSDKNDTPTTITCDQGPLNNVAKLNSDTIVQTNIKNTDGNQLGDIYTKNLTGKDYVVARAKDATMKNGDQIKQLLETIKPL